MLDIYILFEYNIHMMNISRKLIMLMISLISLVCGFLIYIFLREGTYIHSIIDTILEIDVQSLNYEYHFFFDLLKYYIVDFLWCFSLLCSLSAIWYEQGKKSILIISMISVGAGVLYEIAQAYDMINGTADLVDILMYIFAGVFHAIIYKTIF